MLPPIASGLLTSEYSWPRGQPDIVDDGHSVHSVHDGPRCIMWGWVLTIPSPRCWSPRHRSEMPMLSLASQSWLGEQTPVCRSSIWNAHGPSSRSRSPLSAVASRAGSGVSPARADVLGHRSWATVLGLCSSTFARVRYTTVGELSGAMLEAGRTIVVAAELQPL